MEDFKELVNQHRDLRKEYMQVRDKIDLAKTEALLSRMRSSGKFITDIEQRSILTDLCRDLAEIVFEISERYPSIRLAHPEFPGKTEGGVLLDKSASKISLILLSVFTGTILSLAAFIPEPNAHQLFILRVTLALALAGIGVIIPGFLQARTSPYIRFGGAIALFIIIYWINPPYLLTRLTVSPHITGNVRFVENGKPLGPVSGAMIELAEYPGFETISDQNGNFIIHLPKDQQTQEIELLVRYKSETYHNVQPSDMKNVVIEIEKQRMDISGKCLYERPSEKSELWIITQNGNKLTIKTEQSSISGEGWYSYETGEFSYSLEIPITTGLLDISTGKGKIDSTGNKITMTGDQAIFSGGFILKRISD